jgi:hypothetical protein
MIDPLVPSTRGGMAMADLVDDCPDLAQRRLSGLTPEQLVRLARAADELSQLCLSLVQPGPAGPASISPEELAAAQTAHEHAVPQVYSAVPPSVVPCPIWPEQRAPELLEFEVDEL